MGSKQGTGTLRVLDGQEDAKNDNCKRHLGPGAEGVAPIIPLMHLSALAEYPRDMTIFSMVHRGLDHAPSSRFRAS
jgi:hypothetical protein